MNGILTGSAPTIALALWIALVFLLERLFAAERTPPGNCRRIARNFGLGVIALTTAPLLLILTGRIASGIEPLVPLAALGAAGALIVQLLALDIWTYGMHRAYHEIPLLWRFHAPHHLDEHLDASSAFRFHLGEILISAAARLVPALILGIGPATLLLFEAILTANAVFHHSNIRLPERFERALSHLIVTPAIHWRHHHNRRADTDSNYCAILSLWDRLFRSANPRPRTIGMAIGVEGEHDLGFGGLLAYPFRRRG
ncbi:sterol desaturase family protein [Parasphingopyxis marina]|uniref:Sterol desaturase family protein n=1 Tax=Parasphingopyxis marina TaxID=2761622 RepID=A0A842HVL9_9SPHN|nr:sterol desaturase family protein [Parasphingopyxis marina]MBC2776477.1 sterol desaturase family protein [Parasphingopyxis marina]